MSSDPPADERVPLLEPVPPAPSRWLSRYSGATLIIPLALICRVATLLPTTTTFYILQQFVCRMYYRAHDPARVPPDGRMPDALCALPAVEENYAAFIALVALMDGIGSLSGYAALTFLAARLGRRAALAAVLAVGLGADVALISSTLVAPWLEVPLFALWLISASFSQTTLLAFLTNIYIVDLVHEDFRTSALSSIAGWSAFGSVLSFSVGGTITTRGGNLLAVYFTGGALWIVGLLYIWLILPESFPKSKREALRLERARQSERSRPSRLRFLPRLTGVFEPLKHLKPTRDPRTGRRNWRLVLCATHMFFAGLGGGYAIASLLTIVTSLYQYTPAETGYTLTALSATSVLVLTFFIPLLVRVLRPLYARTPAGAGVVEASDRLDVHIVFVSWAVEVSAYIIFGFMRTRPTQLAAVILIGCGPGYAPAVRSLVAASVEPLKQGETLGMIEMVSGLGLLLSPLVMGSILSATIASVPQTVFYVQAAIVLSAAGILFFVRDSDRYQKPAVSP
ncbi:major facilitator superfamily domain-containing protein [Mycena rosella]|uniref:Major facilitator superfamily domain-containing protein n=1 Tax=Mycena rosella TaxID=1033263 RepID=A0AAD7G7Z9_MYCRO|nr:major facilitator superfamily domain-containing protein [Mycena rosella]